MLKEKFCPIAFKSGLSPLTIMVCGCEEAFPDVGSMFTQSGFSATLQS